MEPAIRLRIGALKVQLTEWLSSLEPPTRDQIETALRDLSLLLYLSEPQQGWEASPAPAVNSPICAQPSCKAGWREGLINYAHPDNDPVWFCRQHAIKIQAGGHAPPGTLLPPKLLHDKSIDMAKRWTAFEKKIGERLKVEAEAEKFDWREK